MKTEKKCPVCNQILPIENFIKNRSTYDGVSTYCRQCNSLKRKEKLQNLITTKNYKIVTEKKCRTCQQIKPIDNFIKDKYSIDGHVRRCKECSKVKDKETRDVIKNQEKIIPETKQCSRCKKVFSKIEFYKDKYNIDGLFTYCKKCAFELKYKKSYENKIIKKEVATIGKETLRKLYCLNCQNETSEKVWTFCKDCQIKEINKYKSEMREYHLIIFRNWKKDNKDLYTQIAKKSSKLHRLNNPEKFRTERVDDYTRLTKESYKQLMSSYEWECFKCKTHKDICIDHHICYSKGGRFLAGNLVVLCRSCNSKKRNKNPEDFYTKEEVALLKPILEKQKDFIEFLN